MKLRASMGLLLLLTIDIATGQSRGVSTDQAFTAPLPIPPILENTSRRQGEAELRLTAQRGRKEILPGKPTETMGFNGDWLGPTIRVRRGDRVRVAVENRLGEATTVHWHGLHVPGEMDGGPRQVIGAGAVWRPEFSIVQEAATLWYHPHLLGRTAEHVYRGLGGLFIIDDEHSDELPIPRTYGVDDIPLVLQDRRLSGDGQLTYRPSMPDVMHGLLGNVMLVNGRFEPRLEVPAGMVRFRVLNGSNSSVYRIALGDESPFHQIASDGGFLEAPVRLQFLVLSPGERAEILVDFSRYQTGAEMFLDVETFQAGISKAMKIVVGGQPSQAFGLPARLNTIDRLDESGADRTRRFVMSTMGPGGQLTINGRHMNMDRIDVRIPLGATEVWEITNQQIGMGMMASQPHSMHLHDVQFLVLDIDGQAPPENLRGWKDTVLLWPGETVRVIAHFADFTGIYMYHCHLLEHEDAGMMGQFEVYRP